MKRSLNTALVIGVGAAVIGAVLHFSGAFARVEHGFAALLRNPAVPTLATQFWQCTIALVLSVTVAWLTLTTSQRSRIGIVGLVLLVELLVASWVCALYHVSFQPLMPMVAIALAFVFAERWIAFSRRSRTQLARTFFADRLSKRQVRQLVDGDIPLDIQPKTHEATVVVCDIANKYDMAEESEPSLFAEATEKFIRRTTDLLLEAGVHA